MPAASYETAGGRKSEAAQSFRDGSLVRKNVRRISENLGGGMMFGEDVWRDVSQMALQTGCVEILYMSLSRTLRNNSDLKGKRAP